MTYIQLCLFNFSTALSINGDSFLDVFLPLTSKIITRLNLLLCHCVLLSVFFSGFASSSLSLILSAPRLSPGTHFTLSSQWFHLVHPPEGHTQD